MRLPSEYAQEIAAAAGALLSLSFLESLTVVSAAASLSAGFAVAYYFVPPLASWFGWSEAGAAAAGFVLGIAGFGIAAALHRTARSARDWLPDLVKNVAEKKTGVE